MERTSRRNVKHQLIRELDLINRLGFAGYFLIVWDHREFLPRDRRNGTGPRLARRTALSAFASTITAVDAVQYEVVVRALSQRGAARAGRISISIFPAASAARALSRKSIAVTTRIGAAMTANVITYRGRSASREIGKALNFPTEIIDRFSRALRPRGLSAHARTGRPSA
jgi:error-prone DNA polymerase